MTTASINQYDKKKSAKVRIIFFMILCFSVFCFYSVYLFSLQVLKGLEYQERALAVAQREAVIPSLRGEIFDRNYDLPLVMNGNSFAVSIIPGELNPDNKDEMATLLSTLLEIDKKTILNKISKQTYQQYLPIEIKDDISYDKIMALAEQIYKFPGVIWQNKQIRNYLETGSLSHILGYVGDITREELQVLYNRGYAPNSELGKSGIEKEYDMLLRGEEGRRYSTVDVKGRRIGNYGEIEEKPPVIGKTIVLTIDRHIQTLCEKALGNRMGSVVAMKPATGEILAMVSYPWYNPNLFYGDTSGKSYKDISLDTRFPFLNRAIQSVYAPASVFKIFMTTAILEEEVFSPWERINCEGSIELGGRTFNCHKKTGHGRMDLIEALAESCDVYYWTVGREYVGINMISDYSRRFGFGARTGIDLPGETNGLIPTPEWKKSVYNAPWVGGDTYNVSIGQGYLETTTLQVANAVSLVVNSGVNYVPHLLKEVRDPVTGAVIQTVEPKVLHSTTIRKKTFDTVQEHMRGVVADGSPRVVFTTKAVKAAGKTGTGEVGYEDRWHSWFAAYAPYDGKPEDQVVVVVMVEAVNEWEWWAPKAANVIFQGIFAGQTYEEAVKALNIWYLRTPKSTERARLE